MLRLAFDFIITWRETRTRPNAYRMIEDWILDDIAGLSRYLKLNEVPKLSGDNAFNKIQTLFKRANKVYLKGISIKGFVGEMDFTPIRKCRKSALSELETLLNVNID